MGKCYHCCSQAARQAEQMRLVAFPSQRIDTRYLAKSTHHTAQIHNHKVKSVALCRLSFAGLKTATTLKFQACPDHGLPAALLSFSSHWIGTSVRVCVCAFCDGASRRVHPPSCTSSISGLVVEYIVAIDATRARFLADAASLVSSM